jgi:hypothetical protein
MGSGWQQLTALGISTYLTWRFRGMLHDSVILCDPFKCASCNKYELWPPCISMIVIYYCALFLISGFTSSDLPSFCLWFNYHTYAWGHNFVPYLNFLYCLQATLVHTQNEWGFGYIWWLLSQEQCPCHNYLQKWGLCIWCRSKTTRWMVQAPYTSLTQKFPGISRRGHWPVVSAAMFIFSCGLQYKVIFYCSSVLLI